MPKYLRPSGLPIELKDTLEMKALAEKNGWSLEEKQKRTRRTKEQIEADNKAH